MTEWVLEGNALFLPLVAVVIVLVETIAIDIVVEVTVWLVFVVELPLEALLTTVMNGGDVEILVVTIKSEVFVKEADEEKFLSGSVVFISIGVVVNTGEKIGVPVVV